MSECYCTSLSSCNGLPCTAHPTFPGHLAPLLPDNGYIFYFIAVFSMLRHQPQTSGDIAAWPATLRTPLLLSLVPGDPCWQ